MKGKDFLEWRRRVGWSQQQAALALGVSRTSISNWECGIHPITHVLELALQELEAVTLGERAPTAKPKKARRA